MDLSKSTSRQLVYPIGLSETDKHGGRLSCFDSAKKEAIDSPILD